MSKPNTKIVRIEVSLSIGYGKGVSHEDVLEVEVDEDATDEEIEQMCQQDTDAWAQNYIDYGYSIIKS